MRTWGGDGRLGGYRGTGSGQTGALGSYGSASGSGRGESGLFVRGRRGDVVGSGRSGGRGVFRGGMGSGANCGSGLPHRVSRATRETLAVSGGQCAVLPGRGGAEAPRTLSIRCVGRLRRVGWVPWRGWQVVQVQLSLRGLSRVGVASGRLGSSSLGVVGGRIRLLVGGGAVLGCSLRIGVGRPVVGAAVQVVVLSVHGGLAASRVG